MRRKRHVAVLGADKSFFFMGFSIFFIVALVAVLFALDPGKATGNAITGATSHVVLEETLACDDSLDNDRDTFTDCSDSDCFAQDYCRGATCGLNKIVTWSYILPSEESLLAADQPPPNKRCCADNQCATNTAGCLDYGLTGNPARLCDADQNFQDCSASHDGALNQDGKYYCDGASWKVNCIQDTIYWLNEDETQICDGTRFLTWAEWQRDPVYDPDVQVTRRGAVFSVKEHTCNNGEDDDHDGNADVSDADCANNQLYTLSNTSLFGVLINESDAFKVYSNIFRPSVGVPDEVVALSIIDVYLCDPGLDLETARVCYTEGATNKKDQLVDSFTKLNRLGDKPMYVNANPATSTMFLYENQPPTGHKKAVWITLVRDLTGRTTNLEFPFNQFAANMLAGQNLVLVLDGEFYRLSFPESLDLFATQNLTLTHIPTLASPPAVNYPGSNWYTFSVLGGKKIAVGAFGDKFLISALDRDEEPAAYVIPWNLQENYEVTFKKNQPVRITDPADVGQLTICQDDNPRDSEQVKICRNDLPEFTPRANVLVSRPIEGRNYAFYFPRPVAGQEKEVHVFLLQALSGAESPLDYDNFIDNMVAGRALALEFNNQLYLLKHPPASFLDLDALGLYPDPAGDPKDSLGSQTKVEFTTVDGGKIYIKREYGTPPPPFKVWAQSAEELERTDLVRDLFASYSTAMPFLTFSNPNIGTVRTSGEDKIRYQPKFQISVDDAQHFLPYRVPYITIDENALFYYFDYVAMGTAPEKKAAIYLLYDLTESPNEKTHLFTDQFIETFAGGAELALKVGNSYYRLGHQGNPTGVQFYNPSLLTLKTLDGGQNFGVPSVVGGVARFEVPEGRIEVEVDVVAGVIKFRKRQPFLPVTREEFTYPYWAELTTTNSVSFGSTTLRLCFVSAYVNELSVKVCSGDDPSREIEVLVAPSEVITIGADNYLLETNGQMGANKKVSIRKMIQLKEGTSHPIPDWLAFATEIVENRKPVFNVSDTFYTPSATTSQLRGFGLAKYPTGVAEELRNFQEITPITFNGSLVLHDRVVFIEQQETGDEEKPIEASLLLRPYRYLPDNREALELSAEESVGGSARSAALDFIISLTGKLYQLQVSEDNENVAWVALVSPENGKELFAKFFAASDIKRLTLDGVPVEIKLESIGDEETDDTTKPKVTIKRIG